MNLIHGPEFTPANNGSIGITANGVTESFNRLPYSPNGQNYWTLGYISNYEEVYAINGYFGPYTISDGSIADTSLNQFSYNYYLGTYNGGIGFDSSTGRVYVNKERLLNKQGYVLRLNYQASIDSNVADDFYEGNFYAYYANLIISSGDLLSPDLPDYSDVNAFINGFNDATSFDDNVKNNNDFLLSQFFGFSGDSSGDPASIFGYFTDYDKKNYNIFGFFYDIFQQFLHFISSTEDTYLYFGIRRPFSIYSTDFNMLPADLKYYTGWICNACLCLLIVKEIYRIIISVSTFNLDEFLRRVEVDPTNLF